MGALRILRGIVVIIPIRIFLIFSRSRDSRLQISEHQQRVMMAAAWRRYGLAAVALMAVLSLHLASSVKTHRSFVRKTVASHDIVIFSKSYCPYCKKAKAVFKELNSVPYVVELDQREDGSDIQDALSEIVGRRTVPQVFIHGKHMGGSDDTVEAYESGRLKKLLKIDSKDDL